MTTLRPALFVDLDNTVRETLTGRSHPLWPEDQELRPGVREKLAEFRDVGYAIVGVTNQGGVAFGTLTEQEVREINHYLSDHLAPGLFDLILFSPYHPYGSITHYARFSHHRKPGPGMAHEARDRLGLDLAISIMVGDRETDRLFAENAGIAHFYWAHEFFGAASA
jgi:D-glycero-D-manno-heptose 1,7-bisphosphate phosphatase